MAQSSLFDTMTAQVEAQCEENLARARAEADRILADADAEASAARDRMLKATQAEIDTLDDRSRQKAEAEAAKAKLEMRNDIVEMVMAKVRAEVESIVAGSNFPAILDALLTTLVGNAELRNGSVVLAPEAHVAHVQQWLSSHGHDGVPVEGSRVTWDGVAIQDEAQTYRISNTLTGRYTRVESEARRHCMVSLFGGAEGVQ